MNLYLRLLKLLIWLKFAPTLANAFGRVEYSFRVWPHDIDINLHLNNARYLAFMDLGRTQMIGQLGLLKPLVKRRWLPVAQAVNILFLRPFAPFAKLTLSTRLLSWDHKYFYIEQCFYNSDNQLLARALVKALFLKGHEKISPERIVAMYDPQISAPELSEEVIHWRALTRAKSVQQKETPSPR